MPPFRYLDRLAVELWPARKSFWADQLNVECFNNDHRTWNLFVKQATADNQSSATNIAQPFEYETPSYFSLNDAKISMPWVSPPEQLIADGG